MPVRIRARSEKIALNRVEDYGDAGGIGEGEAEENNAANKQDGAGCIYETYMKCLERGCSGRCPFFFFKIPPQSSLKFGVIVRYVTYL